MYHLRNCLIPGARNAGPPRPLRPHDGRHVGRQAGHGRRQGQLQGGIQEDAEERSQLRQQNTRGLGPNCTTKVGRYILIQDTWS